MVDDMSRWTASSWGVRPAMSIAVGVLGNNFTGRVSPRLTSDVAGRRRMDMRRIVVSLAASIAMLSGAGAETISLLCGLETVIVDTEARTVNVREASLDKQTSEYRRREFKEGNKHKFFGAQVQDYVSVTDAIISYGHDDGPHVNAVHYKIDRVTGVLASSLYGPTTCAPLPARRMF
jgi:hypothetical protein